MVKKSINIVNDKDGIMRLVLLKINGKELQDCNMITCISKLRSIIDIINNTPIDKSESNVLVCNAIINRIKEIDQLNSK